jgi:hypothetical protein
MAVRALRSGGTAVFVVTLATIGFAATQTPDLAATDVPLLDPEYLELLEPHGDDHRDDLFDSLDDDPTFGLIDGAILVEEPVPIGPPAPAADDPFVLPPDIGDGIEIAEAGSSVTEAQALSLNSRPGADRVIFLDVNGHSVTDTAWNGSNARFDVGPYSRERPGFEVDSFTQRELDAIVEIWARVAEDFAPWHVNVTTQDPGEAALTRSNSSDQQYGTRIVITHDSAWYGNAGGVAYVGGFGNPYYSPAFVFSNRLQEQDPATNQIVGGRPKSVAEAASHEAGHTLGLSHDGVQGGSSYYSGHGDWAPIMGSGYSRPVTQWSSGEYPGANNTQDDLAIIDNFLPGRDSNSTVGGSTVGEAAPIPLDVDSTTVGTIGTGGGVSDYTLTVTGTNASILVEPDAPTTNLLARLTVRRAGSTAAADTITVTPTAPTGWTLRIDDLDPGEYDVEIRSIGWQTPSTGFSSYASIGSYRVSVAALGGPTVDPGGTGDSPPPTTTPGTTTPPTEPPGPPEPPEPPITPAGGMLYLDPIRPTRLLDTRETGAAHARLTAGATIRLAVAGTNGIPTNARAAVVNVAAIRPASNGFLSLTPCSTTADDTPTSSLNFAQGGNTSNSTIATLDDDGALCVFTSTATDLAVDITGVISESGAIGLSDLDVRRVADSRSGLGLDGALRPGVTQTIDLRGIVDADATAVAVNVTAIKPLSNGFLRIDACTNGDTNTASLTFAAGQTRGNNGIFELGSGQELCVTSSTASDVTIDITGTFAPGGRRYVPATPTRLLDTRETGPLSARGVTTVAVPRPTGLERPAAASLNLASIGHPGPGFVTAWQCGPMPEASALNPVPGTVTANGAIVALDDGDQACLFSSAGGHLVADLTGWWT